MIRVQNLVKTFGSFTAVDDVSFEVTEGEIFAFLVSCFFFAQKDEIEGFFIR